ncbi:hypothetical protein ANANG_G00052470, partial [Anguilla anguilla]
MAPHLQEAELEPEGRLEPAPEVLVEVAEDEGVDAAVEEGQPVGEREDVDGHQVELAGGQGAVVRQEHQGPQGQPGDREQQRQKDQHVDDPDLLPGDPVSVVVGVDVPDGGGGPEELEGDAGVRDDDEGDRREIDVGEEHCGVDLSHFLLRPRLPAGVERIGVVLTVHHEMGLISGDGQYHCRWTHDGYSQDPDEHDGDRGLFLGELLLKWVDDASEPRRQEGKKLFFFSPVRCCGFVFDMQLW